MSDPFETAIYADIKDMHRFPFPCSIVME